MISNMFSLPFKPAATAQKAKSLARAAVQCLHQWGKPFNIIKVPDFLGMIPLSDDPRFLCSYVHPCGPASLLVCYHLFHICCGVGVAAKTMQVLEMSGVHLLLCRWLQQGGTGNGNGGASSILCMHDWLAEPSSVCADFLVYPQ